LESYEILTAEKVDRKVKEVDEDEARNQVLPRALLRDPPTTGEAPAD